MTKNKLSNSSYECINKITVKYRLWYALLQKSFLTNIVFNKQPWMSVVEFGMQDIDNLAMKNRFLLLKLPSLEHTLAKWTSCEIYL